jgi:hypothetical protein
VIIRDRVCEAALGITHMPRSLARRPIEKQAIQQIVIKIYVKT